MKTSYYRLFEAELFESAKYYESQRQGLAREFVDSIELLVLAIQAHPEAWPDIGGGLRRARIERFPYLVFYRITSGQTELRFLTLRHAARHPDYGRDRT